MIIRRWFKEPSIYMNTTTSSVGLSWVTERAMKQPKNGNFEHSGQVTSIRWFSRKMTSVQCFAWSQRCHHPTSMEYLLYWWSGAATHMMVPFWIGLNVLSRWTDLELSKRTSSWSILLLYYNKKNTFFRKNLEKRIMNRITVVERTKKTFFCWKKMYKHWDKNIHFIYLFKNICINLNLEQSQAFEKSQLQKFIQNTIVDLCQNTISLGSLDVPTTTIHLLSSCFM